MQRVNSLRHVGLGPAAKLNTHILLMLSLKKIGFSVVVFFFKSYRSININQEQNKLCAVCETNLCRDALLWLKIFINTFIPRNSILWSVYYRN